VRRGDRAKSLVCEPKDALRADVEPTGGGHLPVHRQPGFLQLPEGILVKRVLYLGFEVRIELALRDGPGLR
jgi:hypothetical protein